MGFFERLQNIDRRYMYLLLVVVIILPLVARINLPVVVSPAVKGAYEAVERIPSDKIAVISVIWSSGTIAENRPQTEALIRHMFMRGKKFAIVAFDPQGSELAFQSAQRIAEEMDKKYGVDWVHWGYKPSANLIPMLQSLPRDVHKAIGKDYFGTPVGNIPMMKTVRTIRDIGLIADVTPSATLEIWIAFIYGQYRTPLIYAPTAVMAPEGFNPLDAGQIKGMLTGMKGAAEYERLLGRSDFATRAAGALSTSHMLIIVLIILGNIGYISSRRRRDMV
jgi:hypothetical protein